MNALLNILLIFTQETVDLNDQNSHSQMISLSHRVQRARQEYYLTKEEEKEMLAGIREFYYNKFEEEKERKYSGRRGWNR